MKRIIYIFCLLVLFIIFPKDISALEVDYTVKNFYIDAYVNNDGSMSVRELIVLKGSFNGYYRDIIYSNYNNPKFTGDRDDFYNSDIYDAGGISDLAIYSVLVDKTLDFSYINKKAGAYTRVTSGDLGDSYVYEYQETNGSVNLKMFKYTSLDTTAFYIEYELFDVVVLHNDIAELYWMFVGKDFNDEIGEVEIRVTLPGDSEELRVWAHGPLTGDVYPVNKNIVVAAIDDLDANTPIDIRMTFDKKLVPNAKKLSGVEALPYILEIEAERAEEANAARRKSKLITNGISYLIYLWYIGLFIIVPIFYVKYDKERKSSFNGQYYREFEGEYGPSTVGYLMHRKQIKNQDFSASLFNLIYKKIFKLEVVKSNKKRKKEDYKLIDSNVSDDKLSEPEKHLRNWLVYDIGNGKEVTISEIEKYSSTEAKAKKFMKKYNKWVKLVKEEGDKENFFEKKKGNIGWLILYSVLALGLFSLNNVFEIHNILGFLLLPSFIGLFIYATIFTKKTQKGINHYTKWKSFRRFLEHFGDFDNKKLPEIALWEKYLVYATVLGVAAKLEKVMKIRLKDMNTVVNSNMFTYMYLSNMNSANLSRGINSAITRSVSTAISSSIASSSSGSGGGFSGGGGFGGGGGGGGGF